MSGFLCSMVGATFTVAATGQVLRAKKTITAVGNAQVDTAQSQFGGASALFDGTGDYLVVQSNPLPTSGDFTVEFWFRPSTVSSGLKPLWSNRDTGGTNRGVLYQSNSGITWWNASDNLNHLGTMTVNTWHHIACVKDGGTRRLFLNGAGMVTINDGYTAGDLFQIGRADYSGTAFSSEVAGHIDEFRVSNSARYTTNFTPSTTPFIDDSNTVLLIHANGTDASTVFEDDNGIGRSQNDFSLIGNARLSTARSKFGSSSAYFDGTGDYAIAANSITFADNQNFTWEFWVNEDVNQNCKYIGGQTANDIFIGHDGNAFSNRLGVGVVSVGWYIDFGETLALDTWYHLCVQRSGDTVYGYINGVLKVTHTGSLANWDWHWRNVVLGAETTGNTPFNGYLDEMRWSNIVRYATGGFTQPSAPFVNDANTVLLIHAEGTNNSTVITDDNAQLTITPAATSVNEGSSLTFNVSTVDTGDQTLYYTATNAGDFATSSGSFNLASNAGSFSLTPTADVTTEGAETFTASVRIGSTSGDIIATTPSITINDTSVTAATPAVSFDGTNDFYSVSGLTTTATDSKYLTIAFTWFHASGANSRNQNFMSVRLGTANGENGWEVCLQSGRFRYSAPDNSGSDTDMVYGDYLGTTENAYNQMVAYIDHTSFANCKWYVNGVDRTSSLLNGSSIGAVNLANVNFNWGSSNVSIKIGEQDTAFAGTTGFDDFLGRISQIYVHNASGAPSISSYWDTSTSKPKDLGTQGTATGLTRPLIYHYGNTSTFPTNNGTGFNSYTLTATGNVANADGPTYA